MSKIRSFVGLLKVVTSDDGELCEPEGNGPGCPMLNHEWCHAFQREVPGLKRCDECKRATEVLTGTVKL